MDIKSPAIPAFVGKQGGPFSRVAGGFRAIVIIYSGTIVLS
jgi:hypothetical protein